MLSEFTHDLTVSTHRLTFCLVCYGLPDLVLLLVISITQMVTEITKRLTEITERLTEVTQEDLGNLQLPTLQIAALIHIHKFLSPVF